MEFLAGYVRVVHAKRYYKIALEMAKTQNDAEQVLYYEEQIQEMDQQIDNK